MMVVTGPLKDPEVAAIEAMAEALEPLTSEARQRVLRWALDRWRDDQ